MKLYSAGSSNIYIDKRSVKRVEPRLQKSEEKKKATPKSEVRKDATIKRLRRNKGSKGIYTRARKSSRSTAVCSGGFMPAHNYLGSRLRARLAGYCTQKCKRALRRLFFQFHAGKESLTLASPRTYIRGCTVKAFNYDVLFCG